jgi:MOSC domain-containing protein YiiM
MRGEVLAIFTSAAARAPMVSVMEAVLEPGRGLVGDRYERASGTFSKKLAGKPDGEITLIESEQIECFNSEHHLALELGAPRRNIVTRGVSLNALVGMHFRVGRVVLEGMRLCEPCAHLAKIVTPQVLPGLVHRAGLRARVVLGGIIGTGDKIVTSVAT